MLDSVAMSKASSVSVERCAWGGWPEAFRISNGEVELVAVPAVSRILHYGPIGGPNLLWQNASVAGRAPGSEQWTNYGGSKIWIWPEHEWTTRRGSAWPPPTDLPETIASRAEILGSDGLRLTSAPIPGFGVTLVREMRLAASGTRLELRNTIRKDAGAAFPIAAWTVTQVPADGTLFARLAAGSRLAEGYKSYFGSFAAVRREGANVLAIERRSSEYAKIGMDADLLAWQRGERLLVVRPLSTATLLDAWVVGDRAQIYSHFDADPGLPAGVSYVELELTSPMRAVAAGESVTLETSWEMLRLAAAETAVSAVAARLRAF